MRTVQRHLTALEEEGFVSVQRERKPFTYEVAWDRSLAYFPQLKVSMFRPDMLEKYAALK
jgi:DNA-binding transcriptional ArsR family regulator